MNNLKAVFWDVDGTLAETELYGHRKAFNLAFRDFGIDWTWDQETYIQLLDISGGFNRIKYYSEQVKKSLTNIDLKFIHTTKQKYYSQILANGEIPLRKGVLRLLKQLQLNEIKQWIVTTSGRSALNSLLESVLPENSNYFSGFVCYEDVVKHKPDPSAYLSAIEGCGMPIESIIVIEDSLIGLSSASKANLKCLINKAPWNKFDSNNYYSACAVVDDLGEPGEPSNFYIGPKSASSFVDINYLSSLIN